MKERIKVEIDNNKGAIPFKKFMDMCLYQPQIGYYQQDRERTGIQGDFYTSPNVSSIFGEVIARCIYRMWEQVGEPNEFYIVEFGAGKGQLAEAILDTLSLSSSMYDGLRYYIIEASESFTKEQKRRLQGRSVSWIPSVDQIKKPIVGCIVSNELLDAFPVHWVRYEMGELLEKFVRYDDRTDEFSIVYMKATHALVDYFLEQDIQLRNGQEAEVNLEAKDWLTQCPDCLHKGYILTIDYGYLKEELYATHRNKGTLLCYHKHSVHEDPLKNVGEQDITSHVNFSQLISWGGELGLKTVRYMSQQEFLLKAGILECLQTQATPNPFDPIFKRNAAIKQLILPGGMGDTFQVLIQSKCASADIF